MHWLGPYIVNSITSEGAVQLKQLDGVMLPKLVNGSQLKPIGQGQNWALLEALCNEKKIGGLDSQSEGAIEGRGCARI